MVDFAVEGALLNAALSGNVTAQIFWLKNRMPDAWREKPAEPNGQEPEDDPLTRSIEGMGKEEP